MTLLYGWSHLVDSNEVRHLYMEVASLPSPPVRDITRGVFLNFFNFLNIVYLVDHLSSK